MPPKSFCKAPESKVFTNVAAVRRPSWIAPTLNAFVASTLRLISEPLFCAFSKFASFTVSWIAMAGVWIFPLMKSVTSLYPLVSTRSSWALFTAMSCCESHALCIVNPAFRSLEDGSNVGVKFLNSSALELNESLVCSNALVIPAAVHLGWSMSGDFGIPESVSCMLKGSTGLHMSKPNGWKNSLLMLLMNWFPTSSPTFFM